MTPHERPLPLHAPSRIRRMLFFLPVASCAHYSFAGRPACQSITSRLTAPSPCLSHPSNSVSIASVSGANEVVKFFQLGAGGFLKVAVGDEDAVARMGVRPMSPSANFTTYNLPPSGRNSAKNEDAFGHHSYTLPRPKATSSSLLRFLLCSRPCFQQAVDIHRDDAPVDLDLENGHSCTLDGGSNDEDWSLRTELQAVMRHLEVRWQLFDEALSRFGDLEAMLAICANKVRWSHHTAKGAREAHVAEDLKSLISRKLSMEVSISRITQLSSSGELGTSFTRDGYCGQLQAKERVKVHAALDFFNESRAESDRLRSSRLCVLEENNYILCNQRGAVVEEGKQLVIWEQYNATWYIRGCVSYPSIATLIARNLKPKELHQPAT